MLEPIPLLQNVKVAAPCNASWEGMDSIDGDRVHFCAGCKKNVYNLSAMSQAQAEGLLRKHEGRLCVRYYRRTDGTILTRNCPVGQAMLRTKMIAKSKQAAFVTAAVAAISAFGSAHVLNTAPIMGKPVSLAPLTGSLAVEPRTEDHTTGEVWNTLDSRPNSEMGQQELIVPQQPKYEFIGKVAMPIDPKQEALLASKLTHDPTTK